MNIEDLQVGDQVIHRRTIRAGNLIEMGNVVSMDADSGEVLVDKPTLYKMERINVTELEKAGPRYGVKQSPSPATRTIHDFLRS